MPRLCYQMALKLRSQSIQAVKKQREHLEARSSCIMLSCEYYRKAISGSVTLESSKNASHPPSV